MRIEYSLDAPDAQDVEAAFARDVADRFRMTFWFSDCDVRKKIAILVSRYDHCLLEVLWQWRRVRKRPRADHQHSPFVSARLRRR